MKIVMLSGQAYSLVNFRGHLLQEMVGRGHEVIACAPLDDTSVSKVLSSYGVRFIPLNIDRTGMNPLHDLMLFVRLWRLFCHLNPDILLSYAVKPVIYGSLAARLAGVGAIYSLITGLGYAFIGTSLRRRVINWFVCRLYRAALRGNRLVFFQNTDDCMLFVDQKLVRDGSVTRLMNGSGVDLDQFSTHPLPKVDAPVFLLVGRLLTDKGVREFVEAARQLKQQYPACRFRLLGATDSNPASCSPAEVSSWHNEGVIEYCGITSDVRPFLAEATVFVLPSYREGTPRSALEAMATGRAVVTTDAPGCREVVVQGKNGLLVPVKDADALAAAMERFILEPDLAIRMGEASRCLAEERFDVHRVNNELLKAMGLL